MWVMRVSDESSSERDADISPKTTDLSFNTDTCSSALAPFASARPIKLIYSIELQ